MEEQERTPLEAKRKLMWIENGTNHLPTLQWYGLYPLQHIYEVIASAERLDQHTREFNQQAISTIQTDMKSLLSQGGLIPPINPNWVFFPLHELEIVSELETQLQTASLISATGKELASYGINMEKLKMTPLRHSLLVCREFDARLDITPTAKGLGTFMDYFTETNEKKSTDVLVRKMYNVYTVHSRRWQQQFETKTGNKARLAVSLNGLVRSGFYEGYLRHHPDIYQTT
ncbi:hypothetical protein HGB07_00990 [Candidatus Roizmanbacteria bacterium]|nr:hypothetical protein [Candidatus Roizmanbacteria bacterium]